MSVAFEGQGTTFTIAGLTLNPKKITVPGWSKEVIDVTNLNNSAVKTKILATLKDFGAIVLTLEFDPAIYATLPEANALTTIAFVGTTENIAYWAEISEVGDEDLETDTQPVFDVTLTPTNLNASGAETAPVYSAT